MKPIPALMPARIRSYSSPIKRIGMVLCALGLLAMAGCGSGSTPAVGTISITDPNGTVAGQLTSLLIGTGAKVSMTPISDVQNAGVDWAVTCGGNPLTGNVTGGACGSFTPVHTSDGGASIYTAPASIPLGTNVTLTASVTSNPSATRSVTLPIVALPLSVVFTQAPTTVGVGATATYQAIVLNDTSGKGVTFSVTCITSSGDCGSFKMVGSVSTATYTAPASVPDGNGTGTGIGTVSITASNADSSIKSAPVTVTILPAAATGAIAVSLSPSSFYAQLTGAARNISLTATVTNDPAYGGVTWTCSCGSCTASACGTLTPGTNTKDVIPATYTSPSSVPAGNTVTIMATSKTDPKQSATATATITTSTVTIVKITTAAPSTLAENATAALTATASPASQINWTASCGSSPLCGTFTNNSTSSGGSTTYTAPPSIPTGGTVTITATSAAAISNPATSTTTITTPAPMIAFTQEPPSTLTTSAQAQVSATVTNDIALGGVTWTVPSTCGSTAAGACGSIQPYQTASPGTAMYTAPPTVPSGKVTIIATSTSSSSVSVSSTPITITPSTDLSINFIPSAPSQLSSYAVVNLNAAVTNDSTKAGVDWQVCGGGCGFFTLVPAIPAIAATDTTPYVPAVPAVLSTTTATNLSPYWPNGWPNELPISYTAPLVISQEQDKTVTVTATAHANASVSTNASIAITSGVTGPAINGVVRAGTLHVVGASVGLYAAGTSGYGSASTLLSSPGGSSYGTTASDGSFTLPGGYTCPQTNSQVYLVATGGSVGSNAGNPQLSLMTALGPCSNLNSATVVVNEVTTVASVWPLAPFASDDILTGKTSYLNIGTSITNTTGLTNAFATVNNLVNISTGQARYTVPAGNASVPYVEINTLADILNTCTASSGGAYNDGTACGTLFLYTPSLHNSSTTYSATLPADTIQAAMNLAQHPGGGGTNFQYLGQFSLLYGLVTLGSPFQPILTSAPNDYSISLNYTPVSGLTGTSGANYFALDASGNLWITEGSASRIVELNNLGVAISPAATGFSATGVTNPGPLAIDTSGNLWISGSNGLSEIYSTGTPVDGSPFTGGNAGAGMAIDGLSNVWITNGTGVMKFNNAGTELSPTAGYTNSGVADTGPIAIDGSNNVWVGNYTSSYYSIAELYDSSGLLVINGQIPGDTDTAQTQIAADSSGNIWIPAGPGFSLGICEVPAYGGLGSTFVPSCTEGNDPKQQGITAIFSLYSPRGVAIDGAGAVWFGNLGGSYATGTTVQPNITELQPKVYATTVYADLASSSLAAGPLMVAIDGSGNLWVLLANNTLTEYVGAAAPTVTPLALAVKNKKIGAKP